MDLQILLLLGQDGVTNGAIYALLALALVGPTAARAQGFELVGGRLLPDVAGPSAPIANPSRSSVSPISS